MYFNSGRNILWDFFLIRKESFSDNNQFDIFALVINPRDRLDASIIKVVQTLPAIIYLVYNLTFFLETAPYRIATFTTGTELQ